MISPISFINHIRYLTKQDCNPNVLHKFKNYWCQTGRISQISSLHNFKKDPFKYQKLIYEAQLKPVPIDSLTFPHDYNDNTIDKMPLNILLFFTGYFSIKKQIDEDNLEMGWTNNETKNAFYCVYNNKLDLQKDFLLYFFDQLEKPKSNEKEEELLIDFLSDLEVKFFMMLEKYYSSEKGDHEHKAIFRLFFDIQVSIISNDSELELLERWKLTRLNENLNIGGIPDIILFSEKHKIVMIIEFHKVSNL